jgi:type IV secretion system protein VirD4
MLLRLSLLIRYRKFGLLCLLVTAWGGYVLYSAGLAGLGSLFERAGPWVAHKLYPAPSDFLLYQAKALGWGLCLALACTAAMGSIMTLRDLFTPRGTRDTSHGSARWATLDELKKAGLTTGQGIPLHSFVPPGQKRVTPLHYRGDRHLVTVAPNRSGKGTTSIIPALLEYEGSMLVIDPKGQNAAVTAARRRAMGQEVLILNPFGLHGLPSAGFNPLSILDPAGDDLNRDSATLAEALIVFGGHGDSHWTDSARELVQALIIDVVTNPALPDDRRTLAEVRRMLTLPQGALAEEFERMLSTAAVTRTAAMTLLAAKAGRFVGDGREVASIISTAITQTAVLDFPQLQRAMARTDFAFADLKRTPTTVYLVLPADTLASCGRWLRLMISLALRDMVRTPGKPAAPVLFVLDEFAALGHLSVIEQAMGLMAGFGLQLWPILQDLPQLLALYQDRAESFLANAGVVEFFRPNDLVTATWVSRRLGQTTQGTVSTSDSGSSNYGTTGRPLMMADEVMTIPENAALVFAQGLWPVLATRTAYYAEKRYAGQFGADPEQAAAMPAPRAKSG